MEAGLIDVIAPHASFYPDLTALKQTFGDPPERVRWRSKQNLDMAFLMMYAQPRGLFYVQLEDDILAKKNCVSTMRTFALEKMARKEPWFVLVFCQLGFIGEQSFSCFVLFAPFYELAKKNGLNVVENTKPNALRHLWAYSF